MIDRRRRRFDTLLFMTMRNETYSAPKSMSHLGEAVSKNSQSDLEQLPRELARTVLAKWIWRGAGEEDRMVACTGRFSLANDNVPLFKNTTKPNPTKRRHYDKTPA
jgi:hypothetical protein